MTTPADWSCLWCDSETGEHAPGCLTHLLKFLMSADHVDDGDHDRTRTDA